jgi:TPR repeat protein
MKYLLCPTLALLLFVFAAAPVLGWSFEKVCREAEQGAANAQAALGAMYYLGRGVSRDYANARKWLLKAAEQGDANAQSALGSMYYSGRVVSQNHVTARKWLLKAAEQGEVNAQYLLATMYYSGYGGTQDQATARKWRLKAAEQGDVDARVHVGLMYAGGEGVPRDYVQAYMWLNLAAAQGSSQAGARLNGLEKELTSEQLTKVQELIRQWQSKDSILKPSAETEQIQRQQLKITEEMIKGLLS